MTSRSGKQGLRFWRSDGLAALIIVLVALLVEQGTQVFDGLERRFFDYAASQTDRRPSDKVVVLAIDDQSIRNLGRWPWSRDVHARMVDTLAAAKAKTVVQTTFFFEPQTDAGLSFAHQMEQALAALPVADPWVLQLKDMVERAKSQLDTDTRLAQSLSGAANVLLPAYAIPGSGLGLPDGTLPPFVRPLNPTDFANLTLVPVDTVQWPIAPLAQRAAAVGHLNQTPDDDGVVRGSAMFVNHGGHVLPSLALLAASHALNLDTNSLTRQADGLLALGGLRIPTGNQGNVYPQYYSDSEGRPAFVTDSFYDVYAGKIPASKYAGKVVIIGATAAGVGDKLVTPISANMSPAAVMAHETSSLLNNHFFETPDWANALQPVVLLLVALYLVFGLPRLTGGAAAVVTGGLWVLLLAAEYLLVSRQYVWVPLVLPAAVLVLGYLGLTTKRYLVTEAGKTKADEESAETNRMMGLALQGQGQLDAAFDRFRRVPLTDALMDNLLNLALDFERKRQFNKAEAVYLHMATHDKNHKDLQARLRRVKSLSETVLLGGGGHASATVMLGDSGIEKPMLGRYQVEKELGKGAMGVVYLGKDPKIGRVVAIKTMALAREFEGEELDDARQRFFREAETAGRLQHQHIVTIFDAGEDQDLAYIAMEFLRGKDLASHTRAGQLLTVAQVISIVARVADALDYAHQLNVVHRDIKPANVMYEPESDTVKVTDFGIARVTDASRTRTGMVLGTPSFMSPEQIAGKKVDGRSDLYSLGVMAFQLLTGVLPFRAESMAELMFKIANEPAPDARTLRPDLPAAVAAVVAKAMAKSLDVRYARGNVMAAELRQSLAGAAATAPASAAPPPFQADATLPVPAESYATTVVMATSPERPQ